MYGVSKEYPFLLFYKLLNSFDYNSNYLMDNGKNVSVNAIRKKLNVETYKRLIYALKELEKFNLCKIDEIDNKKYVYVYPKVKKYLEKI